MNDMAEYGYLIVNTRTANGAVPVGSVYIKVIDMNGAASRVISESKTNHNGSTLKIRLPISCPNSLKGCEAALCAVYIICADKDGFYPVRNAEVHIYPGITSVQPIELIWKNR